MMVHVDDLRERSVSHVDTDLGVEETYGFVGESPLRTFRVLHAPLAAPVGGLVVCCPYQAELPANYRREVLLARSLAAKGIAVERFHYRGAGQSDGDVSDLTFDSMLEDARAAASRLRGEVDERVIAFMGTRLGGVVAAAAASDFPGAPLALWEPVADPAGYFREIFRGQLIARAKGAATPTTTSRTLEALLEDGAVDVLGYTIARVNYESALAHRLVNEVGSHPRPILLLQMGGRKGLRRAYAELADRWRSEGSQVLAQQTTQGTAWWFGGGRRPDLEERSAPASEVVDVTVEWIARALAAPGATP